MVNLDENHLRVLKALRGASVLRREPGVSTPDGHSRWWSLLELADQGRFDVPVTDAVLADLASAARTLRKNGLVAGRTIFTVLRYCLTDEGYLTLAGWEAAHGLSGIVTAECELEQAIEDEAQARRRVREATARLQAAYDERAAQQAGEPR